MSIRKSLFWALSGQFLSLATNLGTSIIVARLLSPREMGVYAVAFATLGVMQMAVAFDLTSYVVREKHLEPERLDAIFTVNAILSLGLASLVFCLSFGVASFLGEPAIVGVLQLLALGPVIILFEFRPSAVLQRQMQFKAISLIALGRTMAGAAVTIGTASAGESYMSLAWGNIAYSATGMLAFNLAARSAFSLRFSLDDWRAITGFGLRMMSISGVAGLTARLSDIILARILGLTALGLYSRATSISNLIFQNLYGTATRIAFVQLSKDYREHGQLRDTFVRGIEMITAAMWPLLIGLVLLSGPVVQLMFGRQWGQAALPLSILLIAQFVLLAFGMNWELFVLRDETARQTRFEVVRALLGLMFFVAGCLFGLTGAAASRVIEALVGLALYLPHMNRLAGTTSRELFRVYGQSAVLTVAAVSPAAILMIDYHWSSDVPLAMMTGAILAGVACWLVTLALLRHPLFHELRTIMRSK